MSAAAKPEQVSDVLFRVKRGLSGYISYLAACDANQTFSEYILYEPILRILTVQRFKVQVEVAVKGHRQAGSGDHKRIDFVAEKDLVRFAIEVKWMRRSSLTVAADIAKLKEFMSNGESRRGFLCVFGRKSCLERLRLPSECRERGKAVYADFGKTRFGCRIFEIKTD